MIGTVETRRKGGKRGGPARARKLSKARRTAIASAGGRASHRALCDLLGVDGWREELRRRGKRTGRLVAKRWAELEGEELEAARAEMRRRARMRSSSKKKPSKARGKRK